MVSVPRIIQPVTTLNHTALTGVLWLWIDLAPPFRTGEDSVTSVGEWRNGALEAYCRFVDVEVDEMGFWTCGGVL